MEDFKFHVLLLKLLDDGKLYQIYNHSTKSRKFHVKIINQKLYPPFLLVILFLIIFTGCSKPTTESKLTTSSNEKNNEVSNISDKEHYKIALLNYAESFESSKLILDGMKRVAEEYGVELVTADINGDPQRIPQTIDLFLLQNVNAIIDASWFADVGKITVEKCKERGIPLITCDVPFDEEYSYLVGADNYKSGVVAGTYMAELIKTKWEGQIDHLVITFPEVGGPFVRERMQGGIDSLKKEGINLPDSKVIWFDTGGETLKTKTMVTDFLTAHPDSYRILIGSNNDASGLGALSAVETVNRSSDCFIYSYGAEPTAIDNLKTKENIWIASVNFSLNKYGDFAIPSAIRLIQGDKNVPRLQTPELVMIDRSNVQEYFPDE